MLLSLSSCRELSFRSFFNKGTLLAKVGDNELYIDDVKSAFYAGITPSDSVAILNSHIDRWVKSMLKIDEAKVLFVEESDDIDQLIRQYRNNLLTNKYDNYHSSKIDTLISSLQIEEYYTKNRKLYRLASPIVMGRILVYPKSYRGETKLIKLLKSKKDDDINDFRDLVDKHNFRYIEYKDWVYFTQLLKDIPFKERKFDAFLNSETTYEVSDEEYNYIMVIDDYTTSGGYTPLAMIQAVIKTTILNNRKHLLIKAREDTLYRRAVDAGLLFINKNEVDSIKIEKQ